MSKPYSLKKKVEEQLRHDCNCDLAADVKRLQQKVAYLEAVVYQIGKGMQ